VIGVPLPEGLPEPDEIYEELHYYCDVLLGRKSAPITSPYLGLAEVAGAYYARALEMDMLIHQGEAEGAIARGSKYYRLRTGSLRSFIEMAKRLCELGSRRLSQEDLLYRQRRDAGEV
jgi:hypothetical protein